MTFMLEPYFEFIIRSIACVLNLIVIQFILHQGNFFNIMNIGNVS